MKEFRDKHYIIKVGNMYVGDFERLGLKLVSQEWKNKAQKFDDVLVIDISNNLVAMGMKATIIRVDEVTTITETEVDTLEIRSV